MIKVFKEKSLYFLIIAVSFFACSTHRIAVLKTPVTNFGKYSVVEIPDFSTSLGSSVSREAQRVIPDKIAALVEKERLFTQVRRHPTQLKEKVLLLHGVITQFNPGSRLKRGISLGIGHIGAGFVTVKLTFVDKEMNQEIAQLDVEGQINWSPSGGSIYACYDEISKEVLKFIRYYY
ncbi:MAG: DUF4410 domain-containing protein [Candidatus Desulfofervidaceae bacterium]|nr:DUF4410 domain-containing protein [Candidatus Desulfofervidaceae bacterium]